MASNVVTENSFQQDVIEASKVKPVLVDFWATWCPPCKLLSPLVEQIAEEKADLLNLATVDTDENQTLSSQFDIMSIPTLILFKDGEPVKKVVGYMPKAQLFNQFERFL